MSLLGGPGTHDGPVRANVPNGTATGGPGANPAWGYVRIYSRAIPLTV